MRRSLVIARTELSAFLRSKSFLIGLILPPALGIFAVYASIATQPVRPSPRTYQLAILDPTGAFAKAIEQAAAKQNTETRTQGERGWILLAQRSETGERSLDELRQKLTEQVSAGEIWAFVEIPGGFPQHPEEVVRIPIHTAEPPGGEFESWLGNVIQEKARALALRDAELPEELRARLERRIVIQAVLHERPPPEEANTAAPRRSGTFAERLGPLRRLAAGGPLALLTFLLIGLSSAPLMQGVMEEKASRVSEILLSSVSPFELMLGKLAGGIAASGCGAILYVGAIVAALLAFGIDIPTWLFGWFVVFLVLGALLWGSIFLAIGAACADLKDTQNLVLVSMVLQVVPMFFLTSIVMSPTSPTAIALSLFPPATPLVMLLRLSLEPAPPLWQPVLAALLLGACALAAVWVAGRIFRMGLLAHVKSATLREMWRWVRAD